MVKELEPESATREPCARCGEETAIGSIFFSDRMEIPGDGQPDMFLCSQCYATIRSSRKTAQMTDAEFDTFVRNASAVDVAWMRSW